jgi:fumarate reductase subunit C
MRRISSTATFLYKRIFPIVWFGFLLVFVVFGLATGAVDAVSLLPFVIGPLLMVVLGYFLMKKLLFDLVDEVLDAGDALIIRNRDQEDRIALSDIMNVSYSPFINPPRVTLLLRRPSAFGSQVAFCAPVRFVPFASSPIIDELIQRIDSKRRA